MGACSTRRFRGAIIHELGAGLDREFGSIMRAVVLDKALIAAEVDEVTRLADATLAGMERVDA